MMGDRGVHTLDPVVIGLETRPAHKRRGHQLRQHGGGPPAVGNRHVPIRRPARIAALEADLVRGNSSAAARGVGGRPADARRGRRDFKGSKGTILCGVYGEGLRIIPEKRMKEVTLPPKTLPRVVGSHEQDWVRACKTGQQAGADFRYSGPLTETCLLGNLAKRMDTRHPLGRREAGGHQLARGQPLRADALPKRLVVVNFAEEQAIRTSPKEPT